VDLQGAMRRGGRRPSLLARWLTAIVSLGLLAAGDIATAPQAAAVSVTKVSLTFDNNTISQYTLAYQQALQPHNAHATFFVNSGTVGSSANFMSWTQLGTLASAGNDIGGKSVNSQNLTTDPNPTAQVCNDRAAILNHGLTPVGFAYPGGSNNATIQGIVKGCGYGNARTAGGLSATGSTWAETLPPANWFATRAYAPGAVTLANMKSLVTGAASHGGGWDQIVIGKVCSQSLDPNNYTTCNAASGHIELADLNTFLDWVAAAGSAGGAPAGTTLDTVGHVATTSDLGAPTTTIACNGSPCSSAPYGGVVSVTLSATDVGSGVSSIRYTTDGSDPTLSSPTYSSAFNVNGSGTSTTVKYRSWDYAGNVEVTNTQVIQAPQDTVAPTTTIACNGAGCSSSPYISSVTISFAASDTGGSGVDKTYYTTDGSVPTTSSSVYAGPFQLGIGSTTVRFFSTDHAGNAEAPNSQVVQVVPTTTEVTLAFDDGGISQYTLGYQQALQPHGAHATFFVNSGIVGSTPKFISWSQLAQMEANGNDIGSKTVDGTNLTTADAQTATAEVCNDRTALIQHGLDPVAFAYPFGASNQSVKGIVKGCGFGNGRSAGSLSPNGPTYAESIPPTDWFATRAYAPTGRLSLANMETLVSGAATHGGGWSQIVTQKVCSQTQDPSNYATCTASSSWIELSDLNAFLDWMANAGQPGGAPNGAVLTTARSALVGADTTAPSTTISCDGSACPSGAVPNVVHVTFSATDVGSSVASTHYTTDGSDPTLASPTYSKPVPITSPTTVKYRSWDHTGNAEAVQSQFIQATPPADTTPPATTISCNGSPCSTTGYNGSVSVALSADDGTGWGVDSTYYTTDGSQPTTSSPVYGGPFQLVPGTYTVQFFSTDLAGNAEQVRSQQIVVLPPKVVVSLTFDDGIDNQYSLGFKRALQPHGMRGTFFIITNFPNVNSDAMTWSQITALNQGGNEIGAHTMNHVNLKTTTDYQTKVNEVCGSRQALLDHGFYPATFAYPEGAYDATAESIVQGCGFTSGRAAGGIDVAGDGAGPLYAEGLPPTDRFATKTVYDPPTGTPLNVPPLGLSHMEAAINGAAQHGGGWIQLVFHQVCSQTYDPNNYDTCMADWGPIDLPTMNGLLDWLQSAGQPGGAPPGTVVQTVSQVIDGRDTQPPVTQLLCNGAPCQSSMYSGSVDLALSATDPGGSGAAATYYTTDGSTPTSSSPTFSTPFIITRSETLNFYSVDNAGNAEQVRTITVLDQPHADPVVGAAGDIACDPTAPAFNGGDGTATDCRAKATGNLMTGVDAVLPLGDTQYDCGGMSAYLQSYDPAWGRFKPISHPVPGDKEYDSTGTGCPSTPGADYFGYFGASAGDPSRGYYSYDLGSWHVIALNTGLCPSNPAFCASGSAQEQWLQQDLAANDASCTLAYFQNPRFASTSGGGDTTYQPFWQDLYGAGVSAVLNGDSHWYERFVAMDGSGNASVAGMREFIVGTGGAGLDSPSSPLATSAVLNANTHGVLKLVLHQGSYDWTFVHDSDGTFTDSGSAQCRAQQDKIAPITTISCNGGSCAGTFSAAVSVALAPTDTGGSGVDKTYYTLDGSTPTTSSTVYTGPFSVPATTTVKYFSTDVAGNVEAPQSQTVTVVPADTAPPTTTASCDGSTCGPGWHTSSVSLTLSATDTGGSGVDKTYYTLDGISSTVYGGPLSISQTTTVTFYSTDLAGNAETPRSVTVNVDGSAPATTISCDGGSCAGTFSAAVSVALAATDTGGSGVDKTYYTLDGSAPATSSTVYTGPITVSSTTTVRFFSTDVAGDSETPQSQAVTVVLPDTAPPTTTASCDGTTCSGTWYRANVSVALTATDTGGSGVDKTYYTLDGSVPDTNSTVYTGPLTLTATTTVRFFSADLAGNREANQSLTVQIDQAAPTTSITCGASDVGCTQAYQTSVTVALSASDAGGSGVSATYFTLNGSPPTTSSTLYTGPFELGATTTVRYFSVDAAGNAEAPASSTVTVNPPPRDTTAPVSTIRCNTGSCAAWFRSAVTVSLLATDTGGSGVSATYYTLNGSTPTTSSTRYTGAFTISSTTTVKFFSTDVAGNAEVVQSAVVQIDAVAPTTTITCNNGGCTAWFRTAVSTRLAATDTGGSGVATTRYTVDGTNPNTSATAIVYTGPFTVASTQTVRFASTDVAGNQEGAKSQQIRIDAAAPTVAITQPANNATFVRGTRITITVSVTDAGTGGAPASGVASGALYIDGALQSTDRSSPWTFTWTPRKGDVGTHVLTVVATDVAGNSTTSAPVTVRVT